MYTASCTGLLEVGHFSVLFVQFVAHVAMTLHDRLKAWEKETLREACDIQIMRQLPEKKIHWCNHCVVVVYRGLSSAETLSRHQKPQNGCMTARWR
jgi:hypothetical protein